MERLWVDANVVLRFLTGDPPEMAAKSLELMRRAEKGDIGLCLSTLVVAEIVWVLASFYKFPRSKIADVLISLISAEGVYAENYPLLVESLRNMAEKKVDFVDAYLAALARSRGEAVCSFDRDFARLDVDFIAPPA